MSLPLLLDLSVRKEALAFLIAALIVSYLATLLIGLPIHLVLTSLKRKSIWVYLSAGFVVSILVVISIPIIHGDFHDLPRNAQTYLFTSVFGFLGAGVAGLYYYVYK